MDDYNTYNSSNVFPVTSHCWERSRYEKPRLVAEKMDCGGGWGAAEYQKCPFPTPPFLIHITYSKWSITSVFRCLGTGNRGARFLLDHKKRQRTRKWQELLLIRNQTYYICYKNNSVIFSTIKNVWKVSSILQFVFCKTFVWPTKCFLNNFPRLFHVSADCKSFRQF